MERVLLDVHMKNKIMLSPRILQLHKFHMNYELQHKTTQMEKE